MKIQERRRASWPGAPRTIVVTDSKPKLTAPIRFTTCRLTCLPSRLAWPGRTPECPSAQVKLVDEGRRVGQERVVDPEIGLGIGEPAGADVDPVTDIDDRR